MSKVKAIELLKDNWTTIKELKNLKSDARCLTFEQWIEKYKYVHNKRAI